MVTKMRCHKLVADAFLNVFNELLEVYGYQRLVELGIDLYGGCFNFRKMRERSLASILTNDLSLGWWEWSAPPEIKFDGSAAFWEGVAQANPSLGHTIHPDNIRAVLNDPEDIVRTEVLCQWVSTINPVIHPSQWQACAVEGLRLDKSVDTWLAIDLSPDRRQAALVIT